MKLLQINIWGGRLESQVSNLIEREQADILCLQEAISFAASPNSGLFATTETLQRLGNVPFMAFSPVFSFNYMKGLAEFGNGIFSRKPILKTETIFTYLEHKPDFMWGEDSANVRNFVHAVIDVNGTPCNVLTHHGFHVPEHKNGNDETVRQMTELADYIAHLQGPVILTGDFNLHPNSKSLEGLNKLLTNLTREAKLETTRNSLTHKTEACDYIFVNDKVKVKRFEALDDIVSDHKALLLEFEL